jgi:hypothetical protein
MDTPNAGGECRTRHALDAGFASALLDPREHVVFDHHRLITEPGHAGDVKFLLWLILLSQLRWRSSPAFYPLVGCCCCAPIVGIAVDGVFELLRDCCGCRAGAGGRP